MGRGVLEVHLVDAKGLSGSDFLGEHPPSRPNYEKEISHQRVFLVLASIWSVLVSVWLIEIN